MNRISKLLVLTLGLAALLAGSTDLIAGGGGGGGGGGGRGGRGALDPAATADRYRDQLEVTDDTEWSAIRSLIEKVIIARTELNAFTSGGFGGRGGGRGGAGGGAATGGATAAGRTATATVNPAVANLATAIDAGSMDQIKSALTTYRQAHKTAEDKLAAAQDALQKVLKVKQEAVALRLGWVR